MATGSTGPSAEGTRRTSRRAVLAAIGSLAATPSAVRGGGESEATLHVRVYPAPVVGRRWPGADTGVASRVRFSNGWSRFHLAIFRAVDRAVRSMARYASSHGSTGSVRANVERAVPIDVTSASPFLPLVGTAGTASARRIYETFSRHVRDRPESREHTCHLLLWWDPLNADLGYGGTHREFRHVARREEAGAMTVANVGATVAWDGWAVTRNIAIHEMLHTFLSGNVVESVIDSRCDHDLGSATLGDDGTVTVSPMATAYAGENRIGSETFWPGSGCVDHDAFYRHDGLEDAVRFEHTPVLSEGVLEAVSLYVDRHLSQSTA